MVTGTPHGAVGRLKDRAHVRIVELQIERFRLSFLGACPVLAADIRGQANRRQPSTEISPIAFHAREWQLRSLRPTTRKHPPPIIVLLQSPLSLLARRG